MQNGGLDGCGVDERVEMRDTLIKKQVFKRLISALIALAPFAVIKIMELIWFADQYMFEWMSRRNYLYIWVIAIIAAFINKWVGYSIAYAFFCAFWLAVIEDSIRENDKTFFIWLYGFIFLLICCMSFYLIKRHIRKKKERYKKIYDESMHDRKTTDNTV